MTESNPSTKKDWLYFLVSAGATICLLYFFPAWFWLGLPFTLTYLTKALKAL